MPLFHFRPSIERGHLPDWKAKNGSSEIESDEVSPLHNKAHREAEKAEEKTSRRDWRHKKRQRVRGSFIFGDKRHSSFSQTNALIRLSDNLRCSTHRQCLRAMVFHLLSLPASVSYFIKVVNTRDRPHHARSLKTPKMVLPLNVWMLSVQLWRKKRSDSFNKHSQDRLGCLFYHHHPIQKPFNLIRWKYRQDFEKPLHNFKRIICKYKKHMQKAGLQPAVNQLVIKPLVKCAWLDFKRALVTR